MSSLSNNPYVKIMRYWRKRMRNNKYAIPFLITKFIEILVFRAYLYAGAPPKKRCVHIQPSHSRNEVNLKSKIVVVVPAYVRNEKELKQTKRLINRLKRQTYPVNIIIIDDCSPIPVSLQDKNILLIRLKENAGPAFARNCGIDLALKSSMDIIVFTDLDCIPAYNWINMIHKHFITKPTCEIVSGKTESYNKNWLGFYHDMNGTLNGRRFKGTRILLYGPTCNLAITKKVAQNVRFDTSFPGAAGEDIHFCYNAIHRGFNIMYCKSAIIQHDFSFTMYPSIHNLSMFIRTFKKYAKGEKILLKKIPHYYSYLNATHEISNRVNGGGKNDI